MQTKSIANIEHNLCTGCMMCADVCNKHAISFPYTKGFWYPKVDVNKCIECGLCKKKCPIINNNIINENTEIKCYGAKSKDETTRLDSTSGGFFSELGKLWISEGGICVGAIYDDHQNIIHAIGENINSITKLRQSKYAQSNTLGIYKEVKRRLKNNEKILFCGTPCQVEALLSFIGERRENLLTMDFVCLGICSPYVYRKYLDRLEKKYKSPILRVWFKNKEFGWRSISTKINFQNGKTYHKPGSHDLFMTGFVTDALYMRKSCEHCKFRKLPHNSDFTVADFWGLEKINPKVDDNLGMSAIMVNTQKGQLYINKLLPSLDYFHTSLQDIIQGNFSIITPKTPNPKMDEFMEYIENHDFKKSMYKYSSINATKELRFKLSELKSKVQKHILSKIK